LQEERTLSSLGFLAKENKKGISKGYPFFICSFLFVRPKRNEPKKKGAGNDNFFNPVRISFRQDSQFEVNPSRVVVMM